MAAPFYFTKINSAINAVLFWDPVKWDHIISTSLGALGAKLPKRYLRLKTLNDSFTVIRNDDGVAKRYPIGRIVSAYKDVENLYTLIKLSITKNLVEQGRHE